MLADLHIHGLAFVLSALAKGLTEIGFTEHAWVQRRTNFAVFHDLLTLETLRTYIIRQ